MYDYIDVFDADYTDVSMKLVVSMKEDFVDEPKAKIGTNLILDR